MSSPLDDVPASTPLAERRAAGRRAVVRAWGYVGCVLVLGVAVGLAVSWAQPLPRWSPLGAVALAIGLASVLWRGARTLPLGLIRLLLVALALVHGVVLAFVAGVVAARLSAYAVLAVGAGGLAFLAVYTALDLQQLPRLAQRGGSRDELERAALRSPVSPYADAGRLLAELVVEGVPYVVYGAFWLLVRALALLVRAIGSLFAGLRLVAHAARGATPGRGGAGRGAFGVGRNVRGRHEDFDPPSLPGDL